jgi:hypothetical protein
MSTCTGCGTEIQQVTYDMNGGLCMLCKQGAKECKNCNSRSLSLIKTTKGELCMRCAAMLGARPVGIPELGGLESVEQIPDWLNKVLPKRLPEKVVGLAFNLTGDAEYGYELNLVGTRSFDPADPDWACDDVWSTKGCQFEFPEANWEATLERVVSLLREYLSDGKRSEILRSAEGVGVGFVDGDLHVLWNRNQTAEQDSGGKGGQRL